MGGTGGRGAAKQQQWRRGFRAPLLSWGRSKELPGSPPLVCPVRCGSLARGGSAALPSPSMQAFCATALQGHLKRWPRSPFRKTAW